MTGYSRRWDCFVCEDPQESMDRPRVEVCEVCSQETRKVDVSAAIRERVRAAYDRGFIHGRKVGANG